ncbi:MAG TPA: phosphatidylserine/phosphatidylglycerophosphate/cardiolipin synthase family protein [Ktedonobacterales bacterium]|nr:phosphatidylserine/phosphatidylglycerophosphate/cardiolipin synthase family protein [Ktedonobacterales bacterium]
MSAAPTSGQDTLSVRFLAEGEQSAASVAAYLAAFIAEAERSLDIAIYDFRVSDPLKAVIVGALAERARAGVTIRITYDAGKPEQPDPLYGVDPAPHGTGALVQSLGYPFRRIAALKLMHNKYIVRDAGLPSAAVWTGSSNFTDDSWTLAENNILTLASPALAAYYAQDFAGLWDTGDIADTGAFDTDTVELVYAGKPAMVQALFSPGRGPAIDYDVAQIVASAQRRVRICSMLLNSGALIAALGDVLHRGRAPVSGIYDGTQMQQVLPQWQDVPHNRWKIAAVEDIVRHAGLVGKPSTPYAPDSRHDFMHDKALVVDDTVITGSYNFSNSAEQNAENILIVDSPALADAYSAYVDHLIAKYRGVSVVLVDP